MTVQNRTVSHKGIKHKIRMQKRQIFTMSFRLLQTTYSHITQRL